MSEFLNGLNTVEVVFLDVDGVLTDGSILVTEEGHQLRTMNIKDGYALQWAVKQGLRICIISGGNSTGVVSRLKGLGITDVFAGISDKRTCLMDYLQSNHISPANTLYMGDDIPDIPAMSVCRWKTCPQDASVEIKSIADYVSPINGGNGCVRDIIEKILRIQGKWTLPDAHYW